MSKNCKSVLIKKCASYLLAFLQIGNSVKSELSYGPKKLHSPKLHRIYVSAEFLSAGCLMIGSKSRFSCEDERSYPIPAGSLV